MLPQWSQVNVLTLKYLLYAIVTHCWRKFIENICLCKITSFSTKPRNV